MNFLEKLDLLMKIKNLNKHSLSIICGIPYTTIDAFYKKGYDNVKLSTLKKLAKQFDTSIDYLMRDEITDINFGKVNSFDTYNDEQQQLINNFNELNTSGQQVLLLQSTMMLGQDAYKKTSKHDDLQKNA